MDKWNDISIKKDIPSNDYRKPQPFIKANEFDTGFGNYNESSWRELVFD